MDQNFYKQTDEYKQCSQLQQLWIDLSIATNHGKPGESILERRRSPWASNDPEIKAAWDALTSPENLELLREWSRQDMNPVAEEATTKAIEHCTRRQKEGNQPRPAAYRR